MSGSADHLGFAVVELPRTISTSEEAIRFLVEALVNEEKLSAENAEDILQSLLNRERVGSTGIGHGIAIPHTRSNVVREVLGIVGKSPAGLNWQTAVDGKPVHIVCLLIASTSDPGDFLRTLEATVRRLREE